MYKHLILIPSLCDSDTCDKIKNAAHQFAKFY